MRMLSILLCPIILLGCNRQESVDQRRLDLILSNISSNAFVEIHSIDSTSALRVAGNQAKIVIAHLQTTNRLHASAWDGRNVAGSIDVIDRGNIALTVGMFRDNSFGFERYYFTTKSPIPLPPSQ